MPATATAINIQIFDGTTSSPNQGLLVYQGNSLVLSSTTLSAPTCGGTDAYLCGSGPVTASSPAMVNGVPETFSFGGPDNFTYTVLSFTNNNAGDIDTLGVCKANGFTDTSCYLNFSTQLPGIPINNVEIYTFSASGGNCPPVAATPETSTAGMVGFSALFLGAGLIFRRKWSMFGTQAEVSAQHQPASAI